jgi:hypothetical protein
MLGKRALFWLGFKAGWRDARGSTTALQMGAALGIVLGLGLCFGMALS